MMEQFDLIGINIHFIVLSILFDGKLNMSNKNTIMSVPSLGQITNNILLFKRIYYMINKINIPVLG